MRISRDFLETLAASALSGTLFLSAMFIPGGGLLLGFFSPASITWLTYRRGWASGLIGLLLSTCLVAPLVAPRATLSFSLEHALLGFSLGLLLSRNRGVVSSALRSSILVIAASLTASFAIFWLSGLEPEAFFKHQINEVILATEAALKDLPQSSGPAAEVEWRPIIELLIRSLPALVFIGLFLECSANGLLALRILSRSGTAEKVFPSLTEFSLPEKMVWVLIFSMFSLWLPQPSIRIPALNLTLVMLFFFLLQGLSIAAHFLRRANISPLLVMVLTAVVLLQPYLLALPLAAGLLDFKFNFRKRWPGSPPVPQNPKSSSPTP